MSSASTSVNGAKRSLRDRSTIRKPKRFDICLKHGHHLNSSMCSDNERDELSDTSISDTSSASKRPLGKKTKLEDVTFESDDVTSDTSCSSPKPQKMRSKVKDSDFDTDDEESDVENKSHMGNTKQTEPNDYQALIAKNVQEKLAFLEALNIPQVKEEMGFHKVPQKRVPKIKEENEPKRASERLRKLVPKYGLLLDNRDEPSSKSFADPHSRCSFKMIVPRLPTSSALGLKQTCKPTSVDAIESYLSKLADEFESPAVDDITYNKETLKGMLNNEDLFAKVVPDRIYSIAVYPEITSRQLIAAGDRKGNLGIWDIGSKEGNNGVLLFQPCRNSINCLSFETESLVCCSYEGTMKRLDLRSGEFHHIYATPDDFEIRCTHFDKLSEHCYVVCTSEGTVVTVDTRTPGTTEENEMECHLKPVKTVNVHPLQKDYFLTASNDGTASLWDIRNHKKLSPLGQVNQRKSVNCAYFSPVSGNSFMTAGYDDCVKVYECTSLGPDIKQRFSVRHDNQVGRWVTPFRGEWIPNNDELLAVGSKNYPRDIGVFNASDGQIEHSFTSNCLGSIISLIAFHPKIPLIAGGNSSGRVYVFKK